MMELRLPNINGKTEAEQINQIKSYLRQLVDQLNWSLSYLERISNTSVSDTSTEGGNNNGYNVKN